MYYLLTVLAIMVVIIILFLKEIDFLAWLGNVSVRMKIFVLSHPAIKGAAGFFGKIFGDVGNGTIALSLSGVLSKVFNYSYQDMLIFAVVGFFLALIGWFLEKWYNKP